MAPFASALYSTVISQGIAFYTPVLLIRFENLLHCAEGAT